MELETLTNEIRRGIAFREQFVEVDNLKAIMKMYRAQYASDILPKNVTFSTVRGMMPYIFFRNPKILVSVRSGDFTIRLAKPLVQGLADLLMDKLEIRSKMRALSQDNSLFGTCVVKFGSDAKGSLPQGLHPSKGYASYGMGNKAEIPWANPITPTDFVVPYGTPRQYGNTLNAPWCAHRIIYRRVDLLKDKSFDKKAVEAAPGVSPLNAFDKLSTLDPTIDPIENGSKTLRKAIAWLKNANKKTKGKTLKLKDLEKPEDLEYIVVYELWLADEGKTYWLAANADVTESVIIKEANFDIDKLPLRSLPFLSTCYNSDPVYFWGVSDQKVIAPLQREANLLRTRLSYLVRRLSLKLVYDTTKIKPEDVMKLLDEKPIAGLPCEGPPRDAIHEFVASIPPEYQGLIEINEGDVRELTGYSENLAGSYHQGRRTATEAQTVRAGGQSRADDKREIMAELCTNTLKYAMGVVFDTWKDEVELPFVLPGAKEIQMVKFHWKDLQADYSFELNFEDALPDSNAKRRENAMIASQLLGQMQSINQEAVASYVLKSIGMDIDLEDFKVTAQPISFVDLAKKVKENPNAYLRPPMSQVSQGAGSNMPVGGIEKGQMPMPGPNGAGVSAPQQGQEQGG